MASHTFITGSIFLSIFIGVQVNMAPFMFLIRNFREHLLSNLEFLLVYSISTAFAIGFTILCGFCWYPSVSHPEKFVFVVNNDYWKNEDGSLPSFIAANVVRAIIFSASGDFKGLVDQLLVSPA
jgi:hypothetical protein